VNFLALDIDFDGPSLNFIGSKKAAHKGIKERYPRKSRYFTVVGQSFEKTVADKPRHGHIMLPITTSTSDELFSRINIDDCDSLRTGTAIGFRASREH